MNDTSLIYGLCDAGIAHVSEVPSGLACRCMCPACGDALVAKKGRRNRHHFAHHRDVDCPRAAETALHLAAKQILARRRELVLPALHLGDGASDAPRGPALAAAARVFLDTVRLECWADNVVPDVIAWVAGRDLYVEVQVAHAVDPAKRAKLTARGVSTLEIDLSDLPRDAAPADIERRVVDAVDGKSWVFNAAARAARPAALASSRYLPAARYGGVARVDRCPIGAQRWGEKSWAAVEADCRGCPHCVSIAAVSGDVRCAGHLARLARVGEKQGTRVREAAVGYAAQAGSGARCARAPAATGPELRLAPKELPHETPVIRRASDVVRDRGAGRLDRRRAARADRADGARPTRRHRPARRLRPVRGRPPLAGLHRHGLRPDVRDARPRCGPGAAVALSREASGWRCRDADHAGEGFAFDLHAGCRLRPRAGAGRRRR